MTASSCCFALGSAMRGWRGAILSAMMVAGIFTVHNMEMFTRHAKVFSSAGRASSTSWPSSSGDKANEDDDQRRQQQQQQQPIRSSYDDVAAAAPNASYEGAMPARDSGDDGGGAAAADGEERPGRDAMRIPDPAIEFATLPHVGRGESNTIFPGELPGYTGWARPSTTLAHSFRLVRTTCDSDGLDGLSVYGGGGGGDGTPWNPSTSACVPGRNWTATVECRHEMCGGGGSMFYARAYGRAVLPGRIADYGNGTYDVAFLPFDEGPYHVEVVLAFSDPPSIYDMPIAERDEVGYEGYLLPDFPTRLFVVDPGRADAAAADHRDDDRDGERYCSVDELSDERSDGAVETGRWLVTEKNVDGEYRRDQGTNVTWDGYQAGHNSLGIKMDYVLTSGCVVPSFRRLRQHFLILQKRLVAAAKNGTHSLKPVHVVFIGDSNMNLQRETFEKYFISRLELKDLFPVTSILRTNDGLITKIRDIKSELNELSKKADEVDYVVLFNAGLHDLDKFCEAKTRKLREPYIGKDTSDSDFSCTVMYRSVLSELVEAVRSFPALLRVWQSTTAGWPKWGNFAVSWPAYKRQQLPLATNFCGLFNDIAWDVVQRNNGDVDNGVRVMDAYWTTLARPDHRQSDKDNSVGKRMVHCGTEVYGILMRKWGTMIFQTLRNRGDSRAGKTTNDDIAAQSWRWRW